MFDFSVKRTTRGLSPPPILPDMALPFRVRRGRTSSRAADVVVALVVLLVVAVWTLVSPRHADEPVGRTVIGWALIAVG